MRIAVKMKRLRADCKVAENICAQLQICIVICTCVCLRNYIKMGYNMGKYDTVLGFCENPFTEIETHRE